MLGGVFGSGGAEARMPSVEGSDEGLMTARQINVVRGNDGYMVRGYTWPEKRQVIGRERGRVSEESAGPFQYVVSPDGYRAPSGETFDRYDYYVVYGTADGGAKVLRAR